MEVPQALRQRPNWILWRNIDGRKVPFQTTGQPAKSNDPNTWTTHEAAEAAMNTLYAGLGYVFGAGEGVFGIDLDGCLVDGELQSWAEPILAEFPTYAEISPSGTGIKLFGLGTIPGGDGRQKKLDLPLVGGKQPAVEVYGQGRYFTVTGNVWTAGELTDCQTALDALYARLWPTPTAKPLPPREHTSVADRAAAYLAKVPPAISGSGGHNQTFRAACVLVLGFGLTPDDAYPLLAEWNIGCQPQWTEKELRHKLTDAHAKNEPRGWLLDGRGYEGPDVSLRQLLASLENGEDFSLQPRKAEPTFPVECIDEMPYYMRMAYDWILATAIKPQPELTLAACLAMFGAIFGRKVRDDYNTRTNVMTLGLAPSGAGKEHPRQAVKLILYEAGLDLVNGPERVGSHAGIVSSVVQHPVRLFQLDEVGRLLHTMRDPRGAPHLYNIGTVLMQLYSSSGTRWTGDAYADINKVKRIDQPHVCIFGTGVPEGFYSGLTSENLSDGFLGRFVVLESRNYGTLQKPAMLSIPGELVGHIKAWQVVEGGNLNSEHPTPALINKTREADARHEKYAQEVFGKHAHDTEETASIWSRAPEKAAKLALIFACCDTREGHPVVSIEAENWGRRIANYTTRTVIERAGDKAGPSPWMEKKNRAWKRLNDGMTMNEFTRRTQWLGRRERAEIIDDWVEIGAVKLEKEATEKRPKTVIRKGHR